MRETPDIHFSLDDARAELKKRSTDLDLRRAVEQKLGNHFWPEFEKTPRGLVWRNILSPDNSIAFYHSCCKYLNAAPMAFEFLGDMYVSINEEKRGLGQLRVKLENGSKATVNIFDLHRWNKRVLSEISLKDGQRLVNFHHDLLRQSELNIPFRDNTQWAHELGKPSEWYYAYLLHFVAHGVLFETLSMEVDGPFLENTALPALRRIENEFGVHARPESLFPDVASQTANEDFYWWSYPPQVNRYLLDHARQHGLAFKTLPA